MNKEEVQEKYVEFQIIDQQIKQVQKQLQTFDAQLSELESIKDALDELKNVKKGTEILVPVSSGIFIKSELKENDELIVNVGSSVTVKKSVEQTKAMIENQLTEVGKYRGQLMETLQMLANRADEIQKELAAMMGEK